MSAPSGKAVQVYLILKLKALRYFETSGPTKLTRRNVPEDLKIQHMGGVLAFAQIWLDIFKQLCVFAISILNKR